MAAVLLAEGAHDGVTYDVTARSACRSDRWLMRSVEPWEDGITYVKETVEQAWASRPTYGAPDWQVEAWVSTYVQMPPVGSTSSATPSPGSPARAVPSGAPQ